jgi:alpha-tubulin suppressor-like RCC1 family protein
LGALAAAVAVAAMPAPASAEQGALAWGEDNYGQLGVEDAVPSSFVMYANVFEPAPIDAAGAVGAISAGTQHALAVREDGSVITWGSNQFGQLGLGQTTGPEGCEATACSKTPVAVPGLTGVVAVAAGGFHSLALRSDGTVMAWGSDSGGQLGIGKLGGIVASPTAISGLSDVKAIAAGPEQSFAVMADGSVKAWGSNEFGALGLGATQEFSTPTTVGGLSGISAIAADGSHALALREDGTVDSWGYNAAGQVGDGSQTIRDEPVPLATPTEVHAIAVGESDSTALLSNGTVVDWGTNREGELGVGSSTGPEECVEHAPAPAPCSTVPVAVAGLSGVTQIAEGRAHTLALVEGGAVMGWGWDEYGMLGSGEAGGELCGAGGHPPRCSRSPSPVTEPGDASAIAAGGYTSFAQIPLGPARPVVSSITPIAGHQGQEATITITGSGLAGATTVLVGSRKVSSFTVNSETSITATLPSLAAQALDVSVRTPEGYSAYTRADRYAYERLPEISTHEPPQGPTVGGTSVTITGSQFWGVTAVHFGTANAASFTVNSPTSITAVTPPRPAGTVLLTVVNSVGTSTSQKFKFTPMVEGIAPGSGPAAGGTSVTVTGSGFAGGTVFKFGSAAAKSVVCTSSTSCTMLTPAHAAGKVAVKATVNKVTSPAPAGAGDHFTYF